MAMKRTLFLPLYKDGIVAHFTTPLPPFLSSPPRAGATMQRAATTWFHNPCGTLSFFRMMLVRLL
eukprot:2922164-Amphidinium_carterae.1